jgi:hypothetical protein
MKFTNTMTGKAGITIEAHSKNIKSSFPAQCEEIEIRSGRGSIPERHKPQEFFKVSSL